MGPTGKEDSFHKMSPHACLSVKSEPRNPKKSWRGSPVKSCSKVKGLAVARSKILNMDLTGWDEASNLNTEELDNNYLFMLRQMLLKPKMFWTPLTYPDLLLSSYRHLHQKYQKVSSWRTALKAYLQGTLTSLVVEKLTDYCIHFTCSPDPEQQSNTAVL